MEKQCASAICGSCGKHQENVDVEICAHCGERTFVEYDEQDWKEREHDDEP